MYDGSTALILAARLAVEGMVEELITCHADVNAVDELGECTYSCFFSYFLSFVMLSLFYALYIKYSNVKGILKCISQHLVWDAHVHVRFLI